MDYKEELESGMVKDGISWTLWGTTRKTYPHLLPRFQTSKVILSLFESDTQVKILKSKLELATGPGISEFFGLPWLLKIKNLCLSSHSHIYLVILGLCSRASWPLSWVTYILFSEETSSFMSHYHEVPFHTDAKLDFVGHDLRQLAWTPPHCSSGA